MKNNELETDEKSSILLVEDNKIHQESIGLLIDLDDSYQVVATARTAPEAYEEFELHKPDLVLMDLGLHGSKGEDATRHLKDMYPDTKILILTAHPDEHHVFKAFSSGADGYLPKNAQKDELFLAMKYLLKGKKFISPMITGTILDIYLEKRKELDFGGMEKLTGRELEILKMVADNLTSKEIGEKLGIKPVTVDKHRAAILRKLQLPKGQKLAGIAADILLTMKK